MNDWGCGKKVGKKDDMVLVLILVLVRGQPQKGGKGR